MSAIALQPGAPRTAGATDGPPQDAFVRVGDVLTIHHATAPGLGSIPTLDEPESLDDCLIATTGNIAKYRLKPPFRWINYHQIPVEMALCATSNNTPYNQEHVFAPLKVVLAEATPIRAALTFEPCYPWQAKLAIPRAGQRLWMVYAAVAVLNSRLGQAFYEVALKGLALKSSRPHGLKAAALKQIPVARADWEFGELHEVVGLAHQLEALHQGQAECVAFLRESLGIEGYRVADDYERLFQQQLSAVEGRLDHSLPHILGLSEADEDALLRATAPPERAVPAQATLFPDLLPPLPPPPPVQLLDESGEPLSSHARRLPPAAAEEFRKLVRFWEDCVNGNPPRELVVEEAGPLRAAA